MKRVERPKIEQLSTGEQFHLVDMKLFEVIEDKNAPSSIRFEVPDTDMNKRVYSYVEDRNLLIFEGQYYIILVNHLDELGFKDCDAIQVGAELSLQTQENKVTGYFSIEEGLAHTFKGSNFKYINRCSRKNQLQFENFGGESRMKMIRKLLDRFDIECIFDNMTVIFADRIGKTTDKLYKFGYNVNAIKKTTDDSNCSFSVLLLGHKPSKEEGDGPQFTYYYESPLKYKMPELIRYRQAENIDDDRVKDNATAEERCKVAINDIPVVSITVDHKEASFDDSNEPKVGDRAILQHHKYNMDFDVRVVKRTRYPFEETPNIYDFSNKRDELVDRTEEQKKWTSDILSVVRELDKQMLEVSNKYTDRINAITDKKAEEAKQESEAAKKLSELVKENQKNFQTTIIESNTAPTQNLEPGKSLWLDTSKGRPGILKKWNGKTWEPIVQDIDAIKKETLEQVNKQVETTRAELNEKVEAVQKETQGKYNKIAETIDGVTRTISNVQKEQGDISKRVTTTEQTAEGFKQSIESLNKENETITNKINTVEETVEGTKKTISDVQSDTNSLKKTTTAITEQAGKINEKLESVERKVINDKAGGRNLILYSNKDYSTVSYLVNMYTLSEDWIAGQEYTFVIKGSVPQGQQFGVWQNGGTDGAWRATTTYSNGITYVTFKAVVPKSGHARTLSLYNVPQNNTTATVDWVCLYQGNRPMDWMPAPEDQVTNEEFTKKTTEIVKSVDGIKENITKVESNQNKFVKRVTDVEKTADGIKQSVSSIQETQSAQGKQLQESKVTLETQAKAIEAKVDIKNVEDYVSSVGRDNKVRNSLLKKDTRNWVPQPGSFRDTNIKFEGENTLATILSGNTSDVWRGWYQNLSCSTGEEFVASGYFYTDNVASIDVTQPVLILEFLNANGASLKSSAIGMPLENGKWKRFVVTGKAPAGAITVRWRYFLQRNGRLWSAKPMLQLGSVASEFIENAADVANTDELIDKIAEKVATSDYNKKVTELDRQIAANEEGIRISAKKTEVYTRVEADGKYATGAYVKTMESRIDVTEKAITNTVRKGSVISEINQTAEAIKIEAKRINLVGAVTADSIAGKLLEGITIRAKDPNDNNNFTEMSNGKIFAQGFVSPSDGNQWAKKVVTGLEKGKFYSRGYKEDGKEANYLEIAAWGMTVSTGNDGATYGAGSFNILDQGQGKAVSARTYDQTRGWRPVLQLHNPERNEFSDITTDAIHFSNNNYRNEWVTGVDESHLSLYKSRLACDNHWNGKLQIKSGDGSSHNGVVATEFQTTSKLKLKTFVKDLQFDALQDVLNLKIKEYYFKSDVANLYKMREQKEEGQEPYTLKNIQKHYGFMVDDCPDSFTDEQRNGVNLYASFSVLVRGFQQYVQKTDDKLNQIEKVINSENNSKRRNVRKSGGRTAKRSYPREKHLSGSRNRTRSRKSKVKRRK